MSHTKADWEAPSSAFYPGERVAAESKAWEREEEAEHHQASRGQSHSWRGYAPAQLRWSSWLGEASQPYWRVPTTEAQSWRLRFGKSGDVRVTCCFFGLQVLRLLLQVPPGEPTDSRGAR